MRVRTRVVVPSLFIALAVGIPGASAGAVAPTQGHAGTSSSSSCTSGYKPCLKKGPSDYDCYGGGGNGPKYTKPGVVYKVTGSDPYRLDSNNNGKGCE